MGTINNLLKSVKTVDLRTEVPIIIEGSSFEITTLNQLQLYNKGINSDGKKLLEYKNEKYAGLKRALNPAPGFGTPDLFLSGKFYKGFGVVVRSDSFEVDSTDSKSSKLKEKYGDNIFGLTQESKKEYSLGVFYERIKTYITTKTGLRFK